MQDKNLYRATALDRLRIGEKKKNEVFSSIFWTVFLGVKAIH